MSNPKLFPVWSESPSPDIVEQFIVHTLRDKLSRAIHAQTFGASLQDNRCPFCLGDVYTCGCGKAKR